MTNSSVMIICGQRSKGQQICLSKPINDSLSVFWHKDSALEILQCCLFDHHSITFHKIHNQEGLCYHYYAQLSHRGFWAFFNISGGDIIVTIHALGQQIEHEMQPT